MHFNSSNTAQFSFDYTEQYDVAVLGAGVIGISTAYWLAKAGLKVLVVDKEPEPGRGTSFANGGQISVCHAEPWANVKAPLQVLRWLADPTAPLLFRPRADTQQWRWLATWLWECLPGRSTTNTEMILKLALHSRRCLQQLRQEHALQYEHRREGILHFYRTPSAFKAAQPVSALMQRLGCEREVVSTDKVLAIEPALTPVADEIVGGTYTADDESGNAYEYCQEMRIVCLRMGVKFVFEADVTEQKLHNTELQLSIKHGGELKPVKAKHVVVCMGVWSSAFLQGIGYNINMYPAKGYSVTIPVENTAAAPTTSLTDDEYKLVMSRLGDKLRVAGTAELSGYSQSVNEVRCKAILDRVKTYFPEMGGYGQAKFWAGLRPSTPNNVPVIGKTHLDNVWVNTGHGTLGWTMACGSGELLAKQVIKEIKS